MIPSTHSPLANYLRALAVSALVTAALLLFTRPTAAATISSTVAEDNGATTNATDPGNTTPDANQDVYDNPNNHPGLLTAGSGAANTGYNFSSSYTSLSSITSLSITLTMLDGSSATAAQETAGGNSTTVNDYDVNHLVLYFGGTFSSSAGLVGGTEVLLANGTPFYLNGFLTNDAQSTVTFSNIQLSTATGSAIVSLLKSGSGFLQAYVGTNNANDSSIAQEGVGTSTGPAEIFLGNTGNPATANATTALSLSGVPEPGPLALLLTAILLMLPVCWARARRTRFAA